MKKNYLSLFGIAASAVLLFSNCGSNKTETNAVLAPSPWACPYNTLDSMAEAGINPDSVDFSFVFMGCNRVGNFADSVTNQTTANVFQLKRTFNEVCSMPIKPKFFFFLGDLVLGLTQGKNAQGQDTLAQELTAWVQQFQADTFSNMPNSGIRMIAVPGNHEMLYKVHNPKESESEKISANDKKGKKKKFKEELPWASAPAVWRSVMQPFSIQAPDDYGLSYCSQDSLTYSFNYKNTHFVILNTDMYVPANPDSVGVVPAPWIASDVTAARTANSKHIFVMGHKPAYIIYDTALTRAKAAKKDDIIDTNSTNIMWPALVNNQVEGMLSAHRHEFLVTQPVQGQTTQLVAGNGGSLYESHLPTNNQFFGYTKIYVMKNGQVLARSFGRLTPGPKNLKTYAMPLSCGTLTRLTYSANITWGQTVPAFNPLDSIQKQ